MLLLSCSLVLAGDGLRIVFSPPNCIYEAVGHNIQGLKSAIKRNQTVVPKRSEQGKQGFRVDAYSWIIGRRKSQAIIQSSTFHAAEGPLRPAFILSTETALLS